VLLSPGFFEELSENIKVLSQSKLQTNREIFFIFKLNFSFLDLIGCDLRVELEVLRHRMYRDFSVDKKLPIYDPQQFEMYCKNAGARTIFANILTAVSNRRQSDESCQCNLYTLLLFKSIM